MIEMEKVETVDDIPVCDMNNEGLSNLLDAIIDSTNDDFHTSDTSVVPVGYVELLEFQDAVTRIDVLTSLCKEFRKKAIKSIDINTVELILGMTRL